jgi:MOSC domain-containing protein YiiM
MKLISVNVGLPRVVTSYSDPVSTGIFKEPVTSRVMLKTLNLDGDRRDKFRVGSAIVMVTEPRMPCYKLGISFDRTDIVRRFLASERTGFYFAVLQEGGVAVGDAIELIEKSKDSLRVGDITALYPTRRITSDCFVARLEWRRFPKAGRATSGIDLRS